ncbi:MAG: hypothetical protein RL748_1951 [Pseudomonadota bacterium]
MGLGQFDQKNNLAPMADINVTPMVDVMLVLLVIFIITAPLLTHSIQLDLPKVEAEIAAPQGEAVTLAIDGRAKLYWNNDLVSMAELEQRLIKAAKREPQPDVQIRADNDTRYETMAQVMSLAQKHGISKLGFVTAPTPDAPAAAAPATATPAAAPNTSAKPKIP